MQLFKPIMNSINFFNYVTRLLLYMFLIIFGSMFTTCYACHCSCTSTVVPDMVQMNLFGLVHTHSPLYVFFFVFLLFDLPHSITQHHPGLSAVSLDLQHSITAARPSIAFTQYTLTQHQCCFHPRLIPLACFNGTLLISLGSRPWATTSLSR